MTKIKILTFNFYSAFFRQTDKHRQETLVGLNKGYKFKEMTKIFDI